MKPLPEGSRILEQVRGVVVSDMTFEPARHTRAYAHDRGFIAVVLGGDIEKRMGRVNLSVPTTGAYVMPAGVPHIDGYPGGVRLVTIEPDLETELWEHFATLLGRVRRLRGPQIASIARQIAVELRAEDDLRSLAVEGLSIELIAAAMRSVNGASGRPKAPRWLNTVDAFLIESLFRPVRISEIAEVVRVHPAHVARVFRLHHGETICQRIRRLRLDWAIGELVEGDLELREIATRAGFAHQSHFSRVFKQATGWSPAQYRERRAQLRR